jgi:hypothetical protein
MREFSFGSAAATATTGITITGASTLSFLWPAAAPSMNIGFLRHAVGQAANATSAQQRIQFGSKVVATGSGFVSATPTKLKPADPNASVIAGATAPAAGKCGTGISTDTEISAGALVTMFDDNFNVLNGYLFVATPPEQMVAPAGFASTMILWFPTAPGTVTGWNWYQVFAEV